ncbi:hypothetical protein CROQUDRAFT_86502, partial [Cronartium quercuum f. sp. fusiforme G11]
MADKAAKREAGAEGREDHTLPTSLAKLLKLTWKINKLDRIQISHLTFSLKNFSPPASLQGDQRASPASLCDLETTVVTPGPAAFPRQLARIPSTRLFTAEAARSASQLASEPAPRRDGESTDVDVSQADSD